MVMLADMETTSRLREAARAEREDVMIDSGICLGGESDFGIEG